jgi:uncharacterized membrane protein YdjX (TVP38/TMEM64 family)
MVKLKKRTIIGIAVGAALVICVLLYFFVGPVNNAFNGAFSVLSSMDMEAVAEYIRSFGTIAAPVSFLLMMFQSVIAPLPAFLITFANAMIFGWYWGALLSWSGAMAGAALCFFISRSLGRGAVEKLTGKPALNQVDKFFERYGRHTVLVCRLLPFVSFDIVSYAAGLTAISFWPFFIATGVGQLPATVVYSYVGGMLTGGAQLVMTALLILFALSVVVFVAKSMYNKRKEN